MFGLKKKILQKSLQMQIKEAEEFLHWLNTRTEQELGAVLGSGLLIIHAFSEGSGRFPISAFLNGAAILDQEKVALSLFNIELIGMRRGLDGNPDFAAWIRRIGMLIVISTIRGLCYIEVQPITRRIWVKLARGNPQWKDFLKEIRTSEWAEEYIPKLESLLQNIFIKDVARVGVADANS